MWRASESIDVRFAPKATVRHQNVICRNGPIGDIRALQRPETCVEDVGTFCASPCSIKLSKMLNQQFSKDSDLSRGVVPRWSENEDPSFRERIAIH